VLARHLAAGKQVTIVSPEIHGRDPAAVWSILNRFDSQNIYLCTIASPQHGGTFMAGIEAVIFDMDGVLIDAKTAL